MADWSNLLQTFGLAVTVLVVFSLAVWRILAWIAREIIIPGRDRFLLRIDDFFSTMSGVLDRVDQEMARVTASQSRQTEILNGLAAKVDQFVSRVEEQRRGQN